MTPPVPEPRNRRTHTDPQDLFEVHHIVVPAYLVERGHEMLHVKFHPDNRRCVFMFHKGAQADFDRLNRATDELASIRERASQVRLLSSYTNPITPQESHHVARNRNQQ
jgi:hypothetical protein